MRVLLSPAGITSCSCSLQKTVKAGGAKPERAVPVAEPVASSQPVAIIQPRTSFLGRLQQALTGACTGGSLAAAQVDEHVQPAKAACDPSPKLECAACAPPLAWFAPALQSTCATPWTSGALSSLQKGSEVLLPCDPSWLDCHSMLDQAPSQSSP